MQQVWEMDMEMKAMDVGVGIVDVEVDLGDFFREKADTRQVNLTIPWVNWNTYWNLFVEFFPYLVRVGSYCSM